MYVTTNKTEIFALKYLLTEHIISPSDLLKILQGAHVLLADNGRFHRTFKKAEGSRSRISSHPSDAKKSLTYSFQGPVVKEMLFSKLSKTRVLERLDEGCRRKIESGVEAIEASQSVELEQFSWLQLERSPVTDFKSIIGHSYDYLRYKVTQKQQGPFGSSSHVDTRPILIRMTHDLAA